MLSVYEFIHFTCVLNALRHQRKNHLRFSKPEAPRRGAQRLAASTEKPLTPKSTSIMRVHVLNALRRQRKNHFRRSGRVGVTHRVLNALRHQRKNHHVRAMVCMPLSWCSTPCGINGKTTSPRSNSHRRIQRAQRLAASTEKPPSEKPSAKPDRAGAQRLAASTEKPLLKPKSIILLGDVLNALRHQRKNHNLSQNQVHRVTCAQRLAASTEKPR